MYSQAPYVAMHITQHFTSLVLEGSGPATVQDVHQQLTSDVGSAPFLVLFFHEYECVCAFSFCLLACLHVVSGSVSGRSDVIFGSRSGPRTKEVFEISPSTHKCCHSGRSHSTMHASPELDNIAEPRRPSPTTQDAHCTPVCSTL